jgi:signal transduction histidine kinase
MAAAPGQAPAGRSAPDRAPAGGGVPDGGLRTRLREQLRRGWTVDVLIVVGLVAWSLAESLWGDAPGTHPSWAYPFGVLLPLPLLARRRHPLPVLLAVSAIALADLVANIPVNAVVAVLVALYSVGARSDSRRARVVAAVVSEVGVLLATWRWAPHDHRLAAALLFTGTALGSLVLGVYVRTRRAYLAALLDRTHTAERDRDQRALLAAAEERRRIARELHDIVAHSVAVMVALSDGAAATALRDPDAAREASQQASATGRQALGEMHRLLGVLRDGDPDELAPQPTLAQLGDLLTRVRAAGLHVELVESGTRPTLPPSAELAVYRLMQESLTNIVKHGHGVTRVTVSLRYRAAGIDLEVDDNGRPHHSGLSGEPAGHGLVGMGERLTAVNGTLQAGPRADGGWRISAHLPSVPAAAPPVPLSAASPVGTRA